MFLPRFLLLGIELWIRNVFIKIRVEWIGIGVVWGLLGGPGFDHYVTNGRCDCVLGFKKFVFWAHDVVSTLVNQLLIVVLIAYNLSTFTIVLHKYITRCCLPTTQYRNSLLELLLLPLYFGQSVSPTVKHILQSWSALHPSKAMFVQFSVELLAIEFISPYLMVPLSSKSLRWRLIVVNLHELLAFLGKNCTFLDQV